MSQDTLYIISTPGQSLPVHTPNQIPVHPLCRLSPSGGLLTLRGSAHLRGGVLMFSDCPGAPIPRPHSLARALLRLCSLHHIQGILPDLSGHSADRAALIRSLLPELASTGITLFLPEYYAPLAPSARILIPSSLSGGSLSERMEEAVDKFGCDRVVLALERCGEDFTLPALNGCGMALNDADLEALMAQLRPRTHLSRPLCTRYFTYCRGNEAHLVLYDDEGSLREKTACARQSGVFRFLVLQRDKQAVFPNFSPQ